MGLLLSCLSIGAQTVTQTMYFDFGEPNRDGRGRTTDGQDANGHYWNNISSQADDHFYPSTFTIVNASNADTGYKLKLNTRFMANGQSGGGGLTSPSAALLGDLSVATATEDYIFAENFQDCLNMTFNHLNPNKAYRFYLFGSRVVATSRSANFELIGESSWTGFQAMSGSGIGANGYNGNNNNILQSPEIYPDVNGCIHLYIRQVDGDMAYLNAMKIEEVEGASRVYNNVQLVQRMYIDFGEPGTNTSRGTKTEGADSNGNYWSNVHTCGNNYLFSGVQFPIVNSNNQSTGYSIIAKTRFMSNGMSGGGGLTAPSADLLGDMAIASATQDYLFVEGHQDYNIITFRNLNREHGYRFYTFGCRVNDDERTAYFIYNGENMWSATQQEAGKTYGYYIGANDYNGNNANVIPSDIIFPDVNGNITLSIGKKADGGMVHLNAMKIEEFTGYPRPNADLTTTQTLLIDFGEVQGSTGRDHGIAVDVDKYSRKWNNIYSTSNDVIPAGSAYSLLNTSSQSSGITATMNKNAKTNGTTASNNSGGLVGDNFNMATLYDMDIEDATRDYLYLDANGSTSITFSGLDPSKKYRFTTFGCRIGNNGDDNRQSWYRFEGINSWQTKITTSGSAVGGLVDVSDPMKQANIGRIQGNIYNSPISQPISPYFDGTITFTIEAARSLAHLNMMKIEELSTGAPAITPFTVSSLKVTGSAVEGGTDVTMTELRPNGTSTGVYETYVKLQNGSYSFSATTTDNTTVTLGQGSTDDVLGVNGSAFTQATEQVVRIRINSRTMEVSVIPVTLYVKGNICNDNTTIAYKGNGVWEQQVAMDAGNVFLFSDKYFYFAFNNTDNLAVKRVNGSRTQVGMGSEGFSVGNIRLNRGTYTVTLDMRNYTFDLNAPIDENKISFFGSSVCNGQGANGNKGYAYQYGEQLANRFNDGTSDNNFTASGISIGGNTTNDLNNRYDELIHDFGRYVVFGLSLGNEGIHGASNQEAIFTQWRDNMLALVARARQDGKIPVVMNNYTRTDFNNDDYSYVKRLNLLMQQWDVPTINVLGAIDDGAGHWVTSYRADDAHPNTAGHMEFMYAMPPSLFDALEAEKPLPTRDQTKSLTLNGGHVINFAGEGTVHPFTLSVRVKGNAVGKLFTFAHGATTVGTVGVNSEQKVYYTSPNGSSTITVDQTLNNDDWYTVTLTHYYAQQRTYLYVNKVSQNVQETLIPTAFSIGDNDNSVSRNYSELFFWRSAMNSEEVSAHVDGNMLKSSLEIYIPLADAANLINLAQSMNNTVSYTTEELPEAANEGNAQYVTFTATGGSGFGNNEGCDKALDSDLNTKWYTNATEKVLLFEASEQTVLSGYTFVTANDNVTFGRRIREWEIYGSNDEASKTDASHSSWTKIVRAREANNQVMQKENHTAYYYALNTPEAYKYYKLSLTGYAGDIQISEFIPAYQPVYRAAYTPIDGVGGTGSEGYPSVFDGSTSTKVCTSEDAGKFWYVIFKRNVATAVSKYNFVSGDDDASRDPQSWELYGMNTNADPTYTSAGWQLIDKKTKVSNYPTERSTKIEYTVDNPTNDQYNYFFLKITKNKGNGLIQFQEFALNDDTSGYTAISGSSSGTTNQTYAQGVDGDTTSKICSPNKFGDSLYYFIFKAGKNVSVSKYSIATGNDAHDRDPKTWRLYGMNANSDPDLTDSGWQLIDSKNNNSALYNAERCTWVDFTVDNPTNNRYNYFKLEITANHGSNLIQFSDFKIDGLDSKPIDGLVPYMGIASTALFDNNPNTYWSGGFTTGGYGIYAIFGPADTSKGVSINGYSLMSSDRNYWSDRHPKSWTLYGGNDRTVPEATWEVIDKVENDQQIGNNTDNYCVYSHRHLSAPSKEYKYFKLIIDETWGANDIELADIVLHYTHGNQMNWLNIPDNTSPVFNGNITVKDFTYRRYVPNSWGTVCLPFNVTSDSGNAKYYELFEVTNSADGVADGVMKFREVNDVVPAYKPVAMYVDPVKNVNYSGSNVVLYSTPSVVEVEAAASGWKMVGVAKTTTIDVAGRTESTDDDVNDAEVFYISKNKFMHATGTVNVKPMRAYFKGPKGSTTSAKFAIEIGDETTGISPVHTSEPVVHRYNNAVYDLQGRKVADNYELCIKNYALRPGIYIVNGKKIVIR